MKANFQKTFERYLQERGSELSASTVATYRGSLSSFFAFLEDHYPNLRALDNILRRPHVEK